MFLLTSLSRVGMQNVGSGKTSLIINKEKQQIKQGIEISILCVIHAAFCLLSLPSPAAAPSRRAGPAGLPVHQQLRLGVCRASNTKTSSTGSRTMIGVSRLGNLGICIYVFTPARNEKGMNRLADKRPLCTLWQVVIRCVPH